MPLHTVCRVEEVPIGMMKAFTAGDQKIVLYHLEDGFHATQSSCTHMFAPLARGRIVDGCKVQCPLHRARFDIPAGHPVAQHAQGIEGPEDLQGQRQGRLRARERPKDLICVCGRINTVRIRALATTRPR
jgi:nitrite reductase/ring-hydroxylating ferredoxin subunit